MYTPKSHLKNLIISALLAAPLFANATGVLPDTTVLQIDQKTNTAQMGVLNTDDEPLLLLTTFVDIPGEKSAAIYALPAVTRVEPHTRQIVRFLLDETGPKLKVQQLKRVLFEGVPAVKVDGAGKIKTTIRQDLPVIISPADLEQDPEPWAKLHLRWADNKLTLSNPSPYVVRLSQTISLLPSGTSLKLLPHPYVLPGESFSIEVPGGVAADVNSIRLFPASPFGFDIGPFEAKLER